MEKKGDAGIRKYGEIVSPLLVYLADNARHTPAKAPAQQSTALAGRSPGISGDHDPWRLGGVAGRREELRVEPGQQLSELWDHFEASGLSDRGEFIVRVGHSANGWSWRDCLFRP
jgi:hypothetical protein